MVQKSQVEPLLREYLGTRAEILFAYIFGSALESDSFEDVDVGVYVRDLESIGDGFDYAFNMSGELAQLLGCEVDVILMNTAPDHLIYSISGGKLILTRNDDVRVEFITSSWSRYFDIQRKRMQAINDMLS